jgi:hypothetical protein
LTLLRISTNESCFDLPNKIGRPKFFAEAGVDAKGRKDPMLIRVAASVFLLKIILDFEKLTD